MGDILEMLFDLRVLHGKEAMHETLDYMIDNYKNNRNYPYHITNSRGETIKTLNSPEEVE